MRRTLEISKKKSSNMEDDGSVSLIQGDNTVFLVPAEAEKFKLWLNEVTPPPEVI